MKKLIYFVPIALLLCMCCRLSAQTLTRGEYFFDTDPGIGHGTSITISTPSDSVSIPLNISVGSLSQGFHILYARFENNSGTWGLEQGSRFYVFTATIDTGAGPKINGAEYFFDTDPGLGHGTFVSIASSDSVNVPVSVPVGSLTGGFHHLYTRFQYTNGIWGLEDARGFYVIPTQIDTAASPKINGAEYFFDTDPGVGNGTFVAIAASDSVNVPVSVPVGSLSGGFHHLYTRFRYTNGSWGIEDAREFYVIPTQIDTAAPPKITAAEYFFDTEPGLGNGIPIPIGTASDSVNQTVNIPVNALAAGFHHLYTRFKYTTGTWGLEDAREFYVIPAGFVGNSPMIDSAEYFFDRDPGVGHGTQITISPATDSANLVAPVSAAGLSYGPHVLFFRFRYTNGLWGLYEGGDTIVVCTPPVSTITSGGPDAFCSGGSVTLSSDTNHLYHYQWQRNGVNLAGDTTHTLQITDSSGVYDMVIDSAGCPGTSNSITVSVNSPSSYTYSQTICQGQSVTFNGHQENATGTYRDTLLNAHNCDSIVTLNLTVTSSIQQNITAGICQGASYPFNGHNYTQGGTYRDTAIAAGGCDSITTLTLTVYNITTTSFNRSFCFGNIFSFNGNNYDTAGVYADTLHSIHGCDSIIVLNLTEYYPAYDTIDTAICQGNSYLFNGHSYDTTGVYTDTLNSSVGCDSIVTLNLVVNQYPVVSLSWATLVSTHTLQILGMDTVDCLDVSSALALAGGSPVGGNYSGTGVSGDTLYGSLTSGFDTITYTVTQSGCAASANDTLKVSPCEGINNVDIENSILLYPNPASDMVIVQSNLFNLPGITPLLYDVTGKLVTAPYTRQAGAFTFNTTTLASGVYLIQFNINDTPVSKRFVKTD